MIKNFTFSEFLTTSTNLPNVPSTFSEVENIILTAVRLQDIRDRFGKPIWINSGYRSNAVNNAVHGSVTSAHKKGLAVDVRAKDEVATRELYRLCSEMLKELQIDQLIAYHETPGDTRTRLRFVHIGWSEKSPRGQLLFK